MHPGCGIQLAFKLLWHDAKIQKLWMTSTSTSSHFIESAGLPVVSDPIAAAENGCVFADETTMMENFTSIKKVKNILCVCANASGKQQFAKQLGIAGYAATASLSDTDDLLAKLQKASAMQGLRFIEILAPCPNIWLSDTSNTVEICRQAVEIGAWPLYELDRGKFSLSYKPQKLEKIDTFVTLQKKLSPNAEYLEKSWRLMMLGKPFESEI